jgi:hypothetical protein
MKAVILFFGIVLTSIFAISKADKNISGTWVLQTTDSSCSQPVLRIQMGEGIWKGKLDIPCQEVYDKEVYSIIVKGDSVFITIYKDGPAIKARIVNNTAIAGEREQEGRVDAIAFKKI